jgi:hypothetical protein
MNIMEVGIILLIVRGMLKWRVNKNVMTLVRQIVEIVVWYIAVRDL